MLLDVARGFVRDQAPIEVVRSQLETETGFDQATWQAMVDMGWAGIALPDTVGGAGMSVGSAVPVFEALGGGLLGTPLLSTTLAGQLIGAAEGAADWLGRVFRIGGDGRVSRSCRLGRQSGTLGADGKLSGKSFVADASVADCFAVLASENGEPVLALVSAAQLTTARSQKTC